MRDQQPQTANGEWVMRALRQHEGPLLRYAHRLIGDLDRARDVVQETFLRLCRQDASQLEGHEAEWLYTVCRNRAVDIRRKERRMATLAEEQATALPNVDPGPADVAERHDDVARIEEFLKQLPPNQREVIRLKFQGGLSYREISGVTGLSVSNVGFLLHQGLKTARHHFQQCEKSVKQQDASVVKGERS